MTIYLVEEHYHYESTNILGAYANKQNAILAAEQYVKKINGKLEMREYNSDIYVGSNSLISYNVIEVELDVRTYFNGEG